MQAPINNTNPNSEPDTGVAQPMPAHDKDMAARFLALLDLSADRFTFQVAGQRLVPKQSLERMLAQLA